METRNQLLLGLGASERDELVAFSALVEFRRGDVVRQAHERVRKLVFPETVLVSLVITMADGRTAEVGAIGREGVVGFQAFLDGGQMPSATVCVVPGTGRLIGARDFRRVVGKGRTREVVGAFAQGLISEIAQLAACNRLHAVEQRVARWLLFAHDRVGTEFQMTQEYLAGMVGASRTAVALAAGRLASAGIARFRHGCVRILDRDELEARSCECYDVIRGEFARLLGWGER